MKTAIRNDVLIRNWKVFYSFFDREDRNKVAVGNTADIWKFLRCSMLNFFLKNNIISLILPDGLNEVYCQIRVKKVIFSCQKHNSEF